MYVSVPVLDLVPYVLQLHSAWPVYAYAGGAPYRMSLMHIGADRTIALYLVRSLIVGHRTVVTVADHTLLTVSRTTVRKWAQYTNPVHTICVLICVLGLIPPKSVGIKKKFRDVTSYI